MSINLTKDQTEKHEKAMIYPVNDNGSPKGKPVVRCTFNPKTYSLSITNSYSVKGMSKGQNYNLESSKDSENPATLALKELWFDASDVKDGDVTKTMGNLMKLAEMKDKSWIPPAPPLPPPSGGAGGGGGNTAAKPAAPELKPPPAKIAFEWGKFKFLGVIKSLTIEYVLFRKGGIPIRAKANLQMQAFKKDKKYPGQNPSSGNGPTERLWRVQAGDRIDTISAEVYGDATRWRSIARHNALEDPFRLRTGMQLAIPAY